MPEVIGVYDFPPPDECHGIQAIGLQGSPLDYQWKVEKWFTKQRDKVLDVFDGILG